MKYIIVITGASSGFGELTARALAKAGHTVYASMRMRWPLFMPANSLAGVSRLPLWFRAPLREAQTTLPIREDQPIKSVSPSTRRVPTRDLLKT